MEIDASVLCYLDGEVLPLRESKIGILTHAMSYGTGCFEGIRAYYNEDQGQLYMFRALEHYERLHASSRVLLINLKHSAEDLVAMTGDLLRKSGIYSDAYIRPMA